MTESEIWDEINNSWDRMSLPVKRVWEVIKIYPEKWHHASFRNEAEFWVVAIFGNTVIWYNDIEEGFNRSRYIKYGEIQEYWCNQDNLEWTLEHVSDEIKDGHNSGAYASPPKMIDETE